MPGEGGGGGSAEKRNLDSTRTKAFCGSSMTSISTWIEMTRALTEASRVLQRAWRRCAPVLRERRLRRERIARKVLVQWRGARVKGKLRTWITNQPASSAMLIDMLERTWSDGMPEVDLAGILPEPSALFVLPAMDEPFVTEPEPAELPELDAIPKFVAAADTRVLVLMVGTDHETNEFHAAVGETCFLVEWQYIDIKASLFGMNRSSRVWKELARLSDEGWDPDLVVFSCHGVAGTEGMAYMPLGSATARLTHGVWPIKDLVTEWCDVAAKCCPGLEAVPLHLDVCFGLRGRGGTPIGCNVYALEASATNPVKVTGFEGGPVSRGSPWVIALVLRQCVSHKLCDGV